MSHSVILQISKQPIKEDDYFCANSYYFDDGGNVIGGAVDYIRDMDEQEMKEALENLEFYQKDGYYKGFAIDAKERTLTIVSKAEYFKDKYADVQKACQEILDMGIDGFVGPHAAFVIMNIGYYGNDAYGLQLSEYDGSCNSMDYFMRVADEGDKYYIGAVIDYHT